MHSAVSGAAMRSQRLFYVAGHRANSRAGLRRTSLRIAAGAYIGALALRSMSCTRAHVCHSTLTENVRYAS